MAPPSTGEVRHPVFEATYVDPARAGFYSLSVNFVSLPLNRLDIEARIYAPPAFWAEVRGRVEYGDAVRRDLTRKRYIVRWDLTRPFGRQWMDPLTMFNVQCEGKLIGHIVPVQMASTIDSGYYRGDWGSLADPSGATTSPRFCVGLAPAPDEIDPVVPNRAEFARHGFLSILGRRYTDQVDLGLQNQPGWFDPGPPSPSSDWERLVETTIRRTAPTDAAFDARCRELFGVPASDQYVSTGDVNSRVHVSGLRVPLIVAAISRWHRYRERLAGSSYADGRIGDLDIVDGILHDGGSTGQMIHWPGEFRSDVRQVSVTFPELPPSSRLVAVRVRERALNHYEAGYAYARWHLVFSDRTGQILTSATEAGDLAKPIPILGPLTLTFHMQLGLEQVPHVTVVGPEFDDIQLIVAHTPRLVRYSLVEGRASPPPGPFQSIPPADGLPEDDQHDPPPTSPPAPDDDPPPPGDQPPAVLLPPVDAPPSGNPTTSGPLPDPDPSQEDAPPGAEPPGSPEAEPESGPAKIGPPAGPSQEGAPPGAAEPPGAPEAEPETGPAAIDPPGGGGEPRQEGAPTGSPAAVPGSGPSQEGAPLAADPPDAPAPDPGQPPGAAAPVPGSSGESEEEESWEPETTPRQEWLDRTAGGRTGAGDGSSRADRSFREIVESARSGLAESPKRPAPAGGSGAGGGGDGGDGSGGSRVDGSGKRIGILEVEIRKKTPGERLGIVRVVAIDREGGEHPMAPIPGARVPTWSARLTPGLYVVVVRSEDVEVLGRLEVVVLDGLEEQQLEIE